MAKNKRQHTVQKAYLDKWAREGVVHIFDMEKNQLHAGNPKSLFRENYIYNWNDFEGDERYMIDDLITAIESEGLPVIQKLIDGNMTLDDKMKLSNYITVQTIRTPRMKEMMNELLIEGTKKHLIEQLKDPKSLKKLLDHPKKEVRELLADLAKDPEKKVAELLDEKFHLKISNIREIWLRDSMLILEDLAKSNFNADWFLFKAGKKHAFITSDNPVVTISQVSKLQGATKKDLNFTEVTFPLTPKHMLIIRKNSARNEYKNGLYISEVFENDESMREFNWRTASHADRFLVSHSDRLAEKVAKLSKEDWEDTRHTKERAKQQVAGLIYAKKGAKSKLIKPISRVSHI